MIQAVVLAGGKGARLSPYTKILPKPLMPMGDMPILEILLRQLHYCGITEIVLTVGHLAELLHTFFQDGKWMGVNILYSYENEPLGTAGPLSLIEHLDDTFFMTNGDVLTTLDYRDLFRFHKKNCGIATIASHVRKMPIDYGIIQTNENHEVNKYIEKPSYEFLVSMGIYVLEPRVLDYINYNEYLDFPDLILRLINAGERVLSYPFDGYWMDLGRPCDYEQAAQDFDIIKDLLFGQNYSDAISNSRINSHLQVPRC